MGITVLVVDLLSNEEQGSAGAEAVVSFHALNQHVMIRHDDRIQTCFYRGLCDVFVCAASIRVACVHVQVDDDFVHETSNIFAQPPSPAAYSQVTHGIAGDGDVSEGYTSS